MLKKMLAAFVAAGMLAALSVASFAEAGNSLEAPVTVPFSRIMVQDGIATVEKEDNTALAVLAGNYPDNCLTADEARGWYPAELFDEPELGYNGTIKLTGSGDDSQFSWECDGTTVTFTLTSSLLGSHTEQAAACDLDRFLWQKGWYLANIRRSYDVGLTSTTDYYRFAVMDCATNQPVKNGEGQCLYYMVASTTKNTSILDYRSTTIDFFADNAEKVYMNLGSTATITSTYAEEDTVPATTAFETPVTDKDGNAFTGKWYYFQWMIAKNRGLNGSGSYSVTHPIGSDTYKPYMLYTPKAGVNTEIAYALEAEDTLLLYNSDDQLLFPFEGDTSELLDMLKNEDGCHFTDKEEFTDGETNYTKWYQKKSSPVGDIDLDGSVSAYDLTVLARQIAGIENIPAQGYVLSDEEVVYALGDVNFDKVVDAFDLTAFARHIADIETLSATGLTYAGTYTA